MKKIVPEYKINNKGHYSPGILSNGMLYISGQLSRDPDTGVVASGGAREHAVLALANLQCNRSLSVLAMKIEMSEHFSAVSGV